VTSWFQIQCASPVPATEDEERRLEIKSLQEKSLHDVTHELVRQVTSPNTCVREQAMHSLKVDSPCPPILVLFLR
jgi:transformation/transcription domain-associated protein